MSDIILEVIEKSKYGNPIEIIYRGVKHGYISLVDFKELIKMIERNEL